MIVMHPACAAGPQTRHRMVSCNITEGIFLNHKANTGCLQISRRFLEGFQVKSRACLHCFGQLCNVPNLLVCLNIEQKHHMHNIGLWQR